MCLQYLFLEKSVKFSVTESEDSVHGDSLLTFNSGVSRLFIAAGVNELAQWVLLIESLDEFSPN